MPCFTSEQKSIVANAVARSGYNERRALDPSIAEDAAAIRCFLALTGKTADTHPGLFGDLDAAEKSGAPDSGLNELHIVDSGVDAQGRATCRTWYLDRNGSYLSGALALAIDAESGELLALGAVDHVGDGLTPAATRSDSAKPATAKMTSVGFYHSQATPGAAPQFGVIASTVAEPSAAANVAAVVDQPMIRVPGHTAIVIGLGRRTFNVDLDYFYPQDTSDNPILLVPFVGSVDVQQPLQYVDQNGHFTSGLSLSTQLYSLSGRSYSAHLATQSIADQVTGDTATNVVSWSYPHDAKNAWISLEYNPLAAAQDTTSAFFFSFRIPIDNTVNPYFSFNVCSYDWPDQPSVNCVQIPDLQFWWHCVAADAKVTLADGSLAPLGEIDNTKRVRTALGGALGVEATTRGKHEPAPRHATIDQAFELKTAGGLSLILTGGHPVATPDGFVIAKDLTPGGTVLTQAGVDSVASCETVFYDGVFCNLKLGDASDRANGLGDAVGVFYANGVAVGDFDSMTRAQRQRLHSLDYMLPRLPERYRKDYESTLRAIQATNARYGRRF
jgi:hypothetical protein